MSSIVNKIKDAVGGTSAHPGQHTAVLLPSKGSPLEMVQRTTPTAGANQLLVEVKAVALNPVDYYQRDYGFPPTGYPTVLGSDVAGIVASVGPSMPADSPKVGARVAAFATAFYEKGNPDRGAFQNFVLVPAAAVVEIPQEMSFISASTLPMAVETAAAGWYTIGVSLDTAFTTADKKGVLVWGGASSVGSAAVQMAKLMGFTVYVTASGKHHEYLRTLGADKVFDYKSEGVEDEIIKAAKEDNLTIATGYDAVGQLKSCLDVLKGLKGEGVAKLASAPNVPDDAPKVEGVEASFVLPPKDEKEKADFSHAVFGIWLKDKLETGKFVPSPKAQLMQGGLEGISDALDILKKGVSGVKLVLEI